MGKGGEGLIHMQTINLIIYYLNKFIHIIIIMQQNICLFKNFRYIVIFGRGQTFYACFISQCISKVFYVSFSQINLLSQNPEI